MNSFYSLHNFCFFNATTIALMIPTMLLVLLVLSGISKRGYWLLRPADLSINAAGQEPLAGDDGRIVFAIKRLDIYLYGLIFANVQATIFLWGLAVTVLTGVSSKSLFPFLPLMFKAVAISILDVVPIFVLVQVLRARNAPFVPTIGSCSPTRFVFSSMAFILLALWVVPFTQATFVALGLLPGYGDLLNEVFSACIAFSPVPLAIMGMMVAFTSNSTFASASAKRRIHLQSLSPESLAALPEERLHKIVDDARLAKNVEAAEIVSLHLLERAEASMNRS